MPGLSGIVSQPGDGGIFSGTKGAFSPDVDYGGINRQIRDLRHPGPSAVDAQSQANLGRIMAGYGSAVASGRPGNEAMRTRLAMQGMGNAAAQNNQQALIARMQEEQQRQALLAQLLLGKAGVQGQTPGFGTQIMGGLSSVLPKVGG